MTRIVTLGDSITLGTGDPAPDGGWRGWARLLAAGLPKPELHNLASNGAQPGSEPTSVAPTRREDVVWMATKGTRWFLRRSVDLIPYMLFIAAREALVRPQEWALAEAPAWLPPVPGETQAAEPVAE
jgi:hypothetical protein